MTEHVKAWPAASDAAERARTMAHAAVDVVFSTRDPEEAASAAGTLRDTFGEINSAIFREIYLPSHRVDMIDMLNRMAERCTPDHIRERVAEFMAEVHGVV